MPQIKFRACFCFCRHPGRVRLYELSPPARTMEKNRVLAHVGGLCSYSLRLQPEGFCGLKTPFRYEPRVYNPWLLLALLQNISFNHITIKTNRQPTCVMILSADHQLSLQEFLNLPPGEGDITYELVDGQAIAKVSHTFFHSKLTRVLLYLLDNWSEDKGEIYPALAVVLTRRGKNWVPTPDLLYISNENLPADWDEDGACSVPPDLVIEIISPGQTFGQMAAKAKDYLDAKVLRVWVVDSKARSITVFYPDAAPQTYMGDELLTDSLFAGLEFTVEQVFKKAKIR